MTGKIFIMGNNSAYSLGLGDHTRRATPTLLSTLPEPCIAVSAGQFLAAIGLAFFDFLKDRLFSSFRRELRCGVCLGHWACGHRTRRHIWKAHASSARSSIDRSIFCFHRSWRTRDDFRFLLKKFSLLIEISPHSLYRPHPRLRLLLLRPARPRLRQRHLHPRPRLWRAVDGLDRGGERGGEPLARDVLDGRVRVRAER